MTSELHHKPNICATAIANDANKAQMLETCPDISETTMERTLKQFLDFGIIRKIGAGRGASYCKA